jgi:DNA-binding response OmpR family regulator
MPQRILVVDDDKEIVRLVRAYLEQAGYQVLVAYNGETALHSIRRDHPDLVVLDLMLPDRDGWDVTRIVRSDASLAATPIVMLTARIEDNDKIVGLELGADDYMAKPFNPRELMARVRAVLRRAQGDLAPCRLIQAGPLLLDLDAHEVRLDGQPMELTRTEFGLLHALAAHPDRAFTRLEMIEHGLGYSYEGLERTVDSHVKNLRRKLTEAGGSGSAAALIETVFGVGYRLRIEAGRADDGAD